MLKPKFKKEKNDFIFTNIKRKCRTAVIMVAVFIVSVTTVYAVPPAKTVTISDGEYEMSVLTASSTVKGAILENGFLLSKNDEVTPSLKSSLFEGMKISIDRSKDILLTCDGNTTLYTTTAETYRDFLNENNIALSPDDIVSVNLDSTIPEESQFKITRVTKEIVEVSENISYSTSQVNDANLYIGETKLTQPGKDGIKKIKYEVVYNDGKEVSTTYTGEYVAIQPINEVISVGTKKKEPEVLTATVGSHTFKYKNVITCQATAYDLSFESTGKRPGSPGYGITASGTYAKVGTVAVDPKVIPLGTKLFIASTDGEVVYGYCTAEDTGGAIKGNKVDLFYNTTAECLQFGRREVKVYILQ